MHKKDEQRFEKLFADFYAQIYRYLLYKTSSPHAAEELCQEVFSSLVACWDTLQEGSTDYRAWLYGVAKNKLKLYYRKKNSTPVFADIEKADVSYTVNYDEDITLSDSGFTEENVFAAVNATLNLKERELFEKAFVQRSTDAQLSQLYGISVAAIKMRKVRLKQKITDHINLKLKGF